MPSFPATRNTARWCERRVRDPCHAESQPPECCSRSLAQKVFPLGARAELGTFFRLGRARPRYVQTECEAPRDRLGTRHLFDVCTGAAELAAYRLAQLHEPEAEMCPKGYR